MTTKKNKAREALTRAVDKAIADGAPSQCERTDDTNTVPHSTLRHKVHCQNCGSDDLTIMGLCFSCDLIRKVSR